MTVLAVFIGGFGLDCYEINISDDPNVCVRRRLILFTDVYKRQYLVSGFFVGISAVDGLS